MWIENFRQFLIRSFQRIMNWVRGLERDPTDLFHQIATRASFVDLNGLGPSEAEFSIDPQNGRWCVDLSYHYRSLTCRMRVSALEPSQGIQHIYALLQAVDEG